MMKQLKCDGFLKLLKPLFSTLLISCFILLGNFSSALDFYVNPIGSNLRLGDYYVNSNQLINFFTVPASSQDAVDGVLFLDGSPRPQVLSDRGMFAWFNDGLYSYRYSYDHCRNNLSNCYQGFVKNISICENSTFGSYVSGTYPLKTTLNNCSSVDDISNLGNYITEDINYYSFGENYVSSSVYELGFCFGNYDGDILTDYSNNVQNMSIDWICLFPDSTTSENLDLRSKSLSDIDSMFTFTENPYIGGNNSNNSNISDIVYYSDNNQVYYNAFNCMGYYEGFCYSNFAIDDVVDSGTTYVGLFPSNPLYTGATVFDLSNSIYPDYPYLNKWYYWFYSRYLSIDRDLSNDGVLNESNIYDLYNGYSKGNFYVMYKLLNNQFINGYKVNPTDLHTYCDMVINGYNPDGQFTGYVSKSFEDIFVSSDFRNNSNNCRSFTNNNFVLSGSNVDFGSGSYFSGEDMLGVFNKIYTNFKNAFSVGDSQIGSIGILPRYIILGFFLFLLLYIFKR